jgi:hypothetical protein
MWYILLGRREKQNIHVCNERFCQLCLKLVDSQHQCYMEAAEIKNVREYTKEIEETKFKFYDLETKQILYDTGYAHEFNLFYI